MWRISTAAAALFAVSTAQAGPTNNGFESGLFGWTTLGSVEATPSTSVTTFNDVVWQINAFDSLMAWVDSSGGVSAATIESTLGLVAGSLDALNPNANIRRASAIYQDFGGTAGETVTHFFNYVARDDVPFNDPAYVAVVNVRTATLELLEKIASIYDGGLESGTAGITGWQPFSYTTTTTDTYRLAFITTDDSDTILPSALFIDNAAGTCVPNCPPLGVPQPASLGLLGLGIAGLFGVNATRRRRG